MPLSGWFGRKKKKNKNTQQNFLNQNIVIYEIVNTTRLSDKEGGLSAQNVDNTEIESSENLLVLKPQLSVTEPALEPGKRVSSGRNTVLVSSERGRVSRLSSPERQSMVRLSRINETPAQRNIPLALNIPEVEPQRQSLFLEGPGNRFSILNPQSVKPSRPSIVANAGSSVQRVSIVAPVELKEYSPGRNSKIATLKECEEFPLNATNQPAVYAVRRSQLRRSSRQPFSLKGLMTKKKQPVVVEEEDEDDDEEGGENSRIQNQDIKQVAYAAPRTRGRTSSILQQSVKNLTSRNDDIPISRKNIRQSMVADVFSADTRRRSAATSSSPGYVTMERGQGMLVSDILNPITSIFVSDLKDPVPKDPLNKPREYNRWVKPRDKRGESQLVVKPKTQKMNRPANVSVARASTASKRQQSGKNRPSRYDSDDESESDSEESEESYHSRSRYKKPTRHHVYAAKMPNTMLPDARPAVKADGGLAMNTLYRPGSRHSLRSVTEEEENELLQPPYVGRLSSAQKTDIAGALDFLCRPSAGVLKDKDENVKSGS